MKTIETILKPTNGYIISFTRNTDKGWWEIEVGLPISWVYDGNDKIGCEVLRENEVGKVIKLTPKISTIVIDDLIDFVEIIILTNQNIAIREEEFKAEMEDMKVILEKRASKHFEELDILREKSFQNRNKEFAQSLEKSKKPRKPRTSKPKPATDIPTETPVVMKKDELLEIDGKVTTITEETTVIESPKE